MNYFVTTNLGRNEIIADLKRAEAEIAAIRATFEDAVPLNPFSTGDQAQAALSLIDASRRVDEAQCALQGCLLGHAAGYFGEPVNAYAVADVRAASNETLAADTRGEFEDRISKLQTSEAA